MNKRLLPWIRKHWKWLSIIAFVELLSGCATVFDKLGIPGHGV